MARSRTGRRRIVYTGSSDGLADAVRDHRQTAVFDAARHVDRAWIRRRAHPRDLRGRSARRAAAPARGRHLRRDRGSKAGASSRRSQRRGRRPKAELVAARGVRLDEMLACGTTTCEIKSGYGLDRRVRAEDAAGGGQADGRARRSTSSPRFMGAHEMPVEFRIAGATPTCSSWSTR